MIYEYRVYEAALGKMQALHSRFRDHTLRIFERLGATNIGYWTTTIGGSSDQLIYILGFNDMAHYEEFWKAFYIDEEWQKVKSESEVDGALTTRIFNTILTPTDYSPLS